jgi:hypothetical protein
MSSNPNPTSRKTKQQSTATPEAASGAGDAETQPTAEYEEQVSATPNIILSKDPELVAMGFGPMEMAIMGMTRIPLPAVAEQYKGFCMKPSEARSVTNTFPQYKEVVNLKSEGE